MRWLAIQKYSMHNNRDKILLNMKEYRVRLPELSTMGMIILALILLINLCCLLAIFCNLSLAGSQRLIQKETYLGYDFSHKKPEFAGGDQAASNHLFIHQYPFQEDGSVVGIRYLEDKETLSLEIPESTYFVILHPEPGGLRITHLIKIPPDDQPPSSESVVVYKFPEPVRVRQGDVYGHWHPADSPTGPFPLNTDSKSDEGLTIGKHGFEWMDIQPGNMIPLDGFTGRRDYFMNVIFTSAK